MAGESKAHETFTNWVDYSIKNPGVVYRVLFYVGIAYFLVVAAFPVYWLFVVAITPPSELANVGFVPAELNPTVFLEVFETIPFHLYMFNSFVIAACTTLVVIVVGSLAGYAFGRMEFPWRRTLMLLLLTVSYFPQVAFLLPLYKLFTGRIEVFGISPPVLVNTPFALVIPLSAFFLPFATYLLATFYSQIPDGLEDAARVEGTTRIGALYRVILPLSAPGVVTAGVITFIFTYNEFFFSYIMTDGQPDHWSPMLWGILSYQTQYATLFHLMAASSLVAIVPVVVLVFTAQKRIISGLTAGALKE
jgi:multiple sugar transport system permease protein